MPTARARASGETGPFGALLRRWRDARRTSQLELALAAGVSPRHVSFLETGRARPSRAMVLRLAEVLDVPLRERNALLGAAGFAAVYRETDLFAPEMEAVRRHVEFLLERHAPFPAALMDRAWNVHLQNRPATRLFAWLLEGSPPEGAPNLVTWLFRPDGLRRFVVNWEAVSTHLVQRLHRERLAAGDDPVLDALLEELLAADDAPDAWRVPDLEAPAPFVTPVHLRKGDTELSLFTALTTLGTAQDVTLQELRLETFLPLDDRTADFLVSLSAEEG